MQNQISEAGMFNQQLRKQIRRKDIDRRLADRRRQLLDQQKSRAKKQSQCQVEQVTSPDCMEVADKKFEQVYQSFLRNGRKLDSKNIRSLAEVSCTLAGSKVILASEREFLEYLVSQFIMNEKYAETLQLELVLLIFNNCLTVSSPNYSQDIISMNNNNFLINTLSNCSAFLQRIFALAVQSSKNIIKSNAISIIFDIVYNSETSFICTLITNPKYLIINVLSNQMHTEPSKNVVIQTLRCYFLIMKKVNFAGYEQFSKMRKFLILVIRNSNCFELTFLGVSCLYSLLRCLPAERALFSKSNLLGTILTQTISLNNNKLASQAIKLASLMIQIKKQSEIEQIIGFIEKGLQKFSTVQFCAISFKILYEIVVNSLYQVEKLIDYHEKLFNKLNQLFQSNETDRDVMIQVVFCMVLLSVKNKKIGKMESERIRSRVKFVMEIFAFDQKSVSFLEQSLDMLDTNSLMQI